MRTLISRNLKTTGILARPRAVAALPRFALTQQRGLADSQHQQPPAERANSLIAALPGNSLVSKTGFVVLSTGALATAISQELYVVNEETVVLVGFVAIFAYVAKALRTPYKEWAHEKINHIKLLLEATRTEHTQAVADRIKSVEEMRSVVDITKNIFELSKETAKLEAEAFTLKQQVTIAAEVKSVLDSWARYEQQQKENEQAELSKAVIEKVLRSLGDEKTQKDILLGAVAEIEQLVKNKAI